MLGGHAGYATIVDPDQPMVERDTCSCGHCSAVIFLKPGTGVRTYLIPATPEYWAEEAGAFCRCCMRPVCLACHTVGTCRPLERQLESLERC